MTGHEHAPTRLAPQSADWPTLIEAVETLTFRAGFNTNAVVAGTTLLGLAAGVIGVFAMLRKRSLTTDALSHATLPGIAIAFLLAGVVGVEGRSIPVLLTGAAASGALGVLCIHLIIRHTRLTEDAAIGIVLSVFFGAGVVGLSVIQSHAPNGAAGIKGFIYGQAATMLPGDVVWLAGIAAVALVATLLLIKEFGVVCFNDGFAQVDGWPVSAIDLSMMALVVVVTVAGLQAVGLIMVVALLIIPPVAARFWTDRLGRLVLLSGAIGAGSGYLGATVSALLPRQPTGALIVLTAGVFFLVSLLAAPRRGVIATAVRRVRLRVRIASEHLLETAYERDLRVIDRDAIDTVAKRRAWPAWLRPAVMNSLKRRGLAADHGAGDLAFTSAGRRRGARVSRNHALWEQYLVSYADVAPSHVDWSVDQVEHVLSDELIGELEAQLRERGVALPSAWETAQ